MDNGRLTDERARTQRVLARQVRLHRRRLSLRQADLATRAGCAQSSISRIERGELLPSLPQVIALAVALGVKPWVLLRDEFARYEQLLAVACLFAVL